MYTLQFRYRKVFYLLLAASILVSLTLPVFGQVKNKKKLSRIPPALRESLLQRLELFIQYDHAHEYDQQFDLLSRSYLESNKFNREAYVEFKRKGIRGTLLEIKIYDVVLHLKDNYVEIPISAKTMYRGRVVNDSWNFTAHLQNGEWYFDYTWIDIKAIALLTPRPTKPCS